MKAINKLYRLHQFQHDCIHNVTSWYNNQSTSHYLVASPTGTGKSLMELALLQQIENSWIITPRVEIINDMLCKLQEKPSIERGLQLHITTPIRFRNLLMSGKLSVEPSLIIKDEAHHDEADSWKQLDQLMPEHCRYVGFTATPYRGTAKETGTYRIQWGEPNWAIDYPTAFRDGFISMPNCRTLPLVDDDLIELSSSGQFEISTVNREVSSKLEDAFDNITGWFSNGRPVRMTLISVPSSQVFSEMESEATRFGFKLGYISQETPYAERQRLFASCKNCEIALVHINVVSEGVDLAIRNHLDLTPRYSPVSFLQVFGRTTRPLTNGEQAGDYICTNRNLERHGYLLDGCIPAGTIQQSQLAFKVPSERLKTRAFGLQSLGKLQGFHVDLKSGLKITCYNITQMEGSKKHEYFLILHPCYSQPFWFYKESARGEFDSISGKYKMDYGKWVVCSDTPENFKGFKSAPPYPLTDPQARKWEREAATHGLCNLQKVDAKKFQILPVLKDTKLCLQ